MSIGKEQYHFFYSVARLSDITEQQVVSADLFLWHARLADAD